MTTTHRTAWTVLVAISAYACLSPCVAQDLLTTEDVARFASALEVSFSRASPAEFDAIRETKDLPRGLVAALTSPIPGFSVMAEWGEPHNESDVIGESQPSSLHVISWQSPELAVVVFVRQTATMVFLGDLSQRSGCEYLLGLYYPLHFTLGNIQAILDPSYTGQPQVNCGRIVRF